MTAILFTVWNDLSNLVQSITENMCVNFKLWKVVLQMLFRFLALEGILFSLVQKVLCNFGTGHYEEH